MIKFIVGKADKNISAAVRGELISALESIADEQKIIFIVPDQFEYETEKAVYRILDENGQLHRFFKINITTFTRLCREILEKCGEYRPFADDTVKNIIMHKTLSENKSGLDALNRVASRPGFCGRMVKTVSALKTSGITARDLELSLNALAAVNKELSPDKPIMKKLHETSTLYTIYEKLLDKYVDKLDITSMAADCIEKEACDTFENASVFVDCFNDFTQSQLHFLECVMLRAENVTFGFTAQLGNDCDVFRTANGHIDRLNMFAKKEGLDIEPPVTEGIKSRFEDNSPLAGLSKHLFQDTKGGGLGENFELVTARGVYEELDYAAAKIKELTIDKGMRYNEIAVLCTDVDTYGTYVENVFKKYDIPMFLDTPEPILYQPLINFVNSILNALEDYSVETVLSCVKTQFFSKPWTGPDKNDNKTDESDEEFEKAIEEEEEEAVKKQKYSVLSDKDVDGFEKYVYEWDLKTSHLKKEFSFSASKDEKEKDYDRQTAEMVRQVVAVPLWELRKELIGSGQTVNGAELTEKLYDFLINKVKVRRAIYRRCKDEQGIVDDKKTAFYQRLWDTLIEILNKLHDELSDTNLSFAEYGDLFREICASTKLADPPQFIDCVLVGDIDRTRADNIKAAFIVGASYEAFPTPASEAGIFSQYEIELIYDKLVHIKGNADVSPYIEMLSDIGKNSRREYCLKSVKEQQYLSLYRAYRAITLPTEYLCISCPKHDASGGIQVCSDVFNEITSTFENVDVIEAEKFKNDFYCRTPKAAKMRYAMGLNEQSAENAVLRDVIEIEDKEFVKTLDAIREAREEKKYDSNDPDSDFSGKHTIKPETAKLLFPRSTGATAIEKLCKCKFEYFCEFGLSISERNKRNFTVAKRGEAMHHIFDRIFKKYSGDMDAFFNLKRSELLALSKEYLTEYREKETNNDNNDDKRTEYLFNNIANSAADVLITIQTELFPRRYRPKFLEVDMKTKSKVGENKLVDNEQKTATTLPEPELYSDKAEKPTSEPKDTKPADDAPYLMTAPLSIELDDGTKFTVRGIIDRVDMFNEGETDDGKQIEYIRVVDYKRSAHTFDLNMAENGINIQMLLYLFALQNANKDNPTLELRPGGVNYIPSLNVGASDKQVSPYQLLAMSYHESGLFIADEVTQKDLDAYLDLVSQKLESDTSLDPKKREKIVRSFAPNEKNNLAEAGLFNDLRENVMKKIKENLNDIFEGSIHAIPVSYYETIIDTDGAAKKSTSKPKCACDYCRFKDICQNAGKNVNKLYNTEWENKYISRVEGKEEEADGEK